MINISKKFHFYAAHRNTALGEKDKCASLHGHTYIVEIEVGALEKENLEKGVLIRFSTLEELVMPVIERLDHSVLLKEGDSLWEPLVRENQKINLFHVETSAENLAEWLYNEVSPPLRKQNLKVVKLSLKETQTSTVTYKPHD